jgi:hypothetical protein
MAKLTNPDAANPVPTRGCDATGPSGISSITVLHIDDELPIRQMITLGLTALGMTVLTAGEPALAITVSAPCQSSMLFPQVRLEKAARVL